MLPAEILIQILENIQTNAWTNVVDKRTLRSCCLVQSTWRRIAQPLLFRDLKIERFVSNDNLQRTQASVNGLNSLLECIEERPELASYIRNLRLDRMRRPRVHHLSAHVVLTIADQDQCIVSLLPKLNHLRSIELYDVDNPSLPSGIRHSIHSRFRLSSLTSLRLTRSIFPSAFDLLTTLINATSLQSLHLSHLDFDADRYSVTGAGPLIPSPNDAAQCQPRSIHLTNLHLEISTNFMTFIHFFDARHCPFSFGALRSLALIRPRGNPQAFDPLFDPPSDLDHGLLAAAFQAIGREVRHLSLGYSLQGGSFPLLKLTPSLQSLSLSRLIHSPTSNPVERIQGLFPPSVHTLENIVLCISVMGYSSSSADASIFWSPWQNLDAFLADTSRFPSLRQVLFMPEFPPEVGRTPNTKALIQAHFPLLLGGRKLVVKETVA
ncbi:hypothetical protein PQX77_004266 [Marasmius sp. AFHP31]|nr:hypothetical protein PQX77_004266 [Marasmius sp. AFHP31]